MADYENNIVKIIEAAGKRRQARQQAENEFKVEILKEAIKQKIQSQRSMQEARQKFQLEEQKNRSLKPQNYTPEQMYLRRRALEENPLAQLNFPEEGQVQPGQNFAITYPKDEVTYDKTQDRFNLAPISEDRKAQMLITKVDQMLAQGRKPHPAVLNIANRLRDHLKQKAEMTTTKEERLTKQNNLNNLRMYGGTVDDENLKDLGLDMESYAKAGGAVATIGKDGKRVWQVMPYEQFKANVAQGKWNASEVKDFQTAVVENNQWKQILKTADELGIGEGDLPYLGQIEFDVVNSPYGTFSLPARFNTFAQYAKDPKYTALKRQIETAFQAFRKRVTGAQAGEKELVYLRQIMPDLKDRPEIFFTVIKQLMQDNESELNAKLEAYKAFGRDTTDLETYMESFNDIKEPDSDSDDGNGTEPTATNPATGEKMAFRGGKWVPF